MVTQTPIVKQNHTLLLQVDDVKRCFFAFYTLATLNPGQAGALSRLCLCQPEFGLEIEDIKCHVGRLESTLEAFVDLERTGWLQSGLSATSHYYSVTPQHSPA